MDRNEKGEIMAEKKREWSGTKKKKPALCPVSRKCGGCQYLDMPYAEQLSMKQAQMQKLLGKFCKVYPIHGMQDPFHYRNKVHFRTCK